MQKKSDSAIRVMREEDIKSLVQAFCFPWSSKQKTADKWNRYFTELKNGIRTIYVVEKQGQLIGYGSLLFHSEYTPNIPEIHDIWIDKDYRHAGIGTKLIVNLEDLARGKGYKQVYMGVGLYKDYGPAQRLYFKLGYVPDGQGITYKNQSVEPGEKYPVDDDLLLWLIKSL